MFATPFLSEPFASHTAPSCLFFPCISLLRSPAFINIVWITHPPSKGDFGFSKDKFDDSAPQTQIGTALFTAPEVFLNVNGHVYEGEAVDVWSLGVVRACKNLVNNMDSISCISFISPVSLRFCTCSYLETIHSFLLRTWRWTRPHRWWEANLSMRMIPSTFDI